MGISTCPVIGRDLTMQRMGETDPVVTVAQEPLTPVPENFSDLAREFADRDALYVFLVDPAEGNYCAYPAALHGIKRLRESMADDLPVVNGTPLDAFGAATVLTSEKLTLHRSALLFDPKEVVAFAQSTTDSRWFLVGDGYNVLYFHKAMLAATNEIYAAWREDWPRVGALELVAPAMGDGPIANVDADRDLAVFLDWLAIEQPTLWDQVADHVVMRERMLESLPGIADEQGPLANYAQETGVIYLYDVQVRSFFALGQYGMLRMYLRHEWFHQRNAEMGRKSPTEEVVGRALDLVMDAVEREEPIMVWAAVHDYLRRRFLYPLPEEEMGAYAAQFMDVTFSGDIDAPRVTQESVLESYLDYADDMINRPWTVAELGLDYFLLVSQEATATQAAAELFGRFVEDFAIRVDCLRTAGKAQTDPTVCRQPTPAMSDIRKALID